MARERRPALQVGKVGWICTVSVFVTLQACRIFAKPRAKSEWTPVSGPMFFPKQLSDKHPPMVPPRVIDVTKMRKVVTTARCLLFISPVAEGQNAARSSRDLVQ